MRHWLGAGILLTLAGCATAPTFYNPYIEDSQSLERQLTIDRGYCTQVAAGSVPMPEVRHYRSGIESYSISGSSSMTDSQGITTRGTYQGYVNRSPNAGDAFAAGMANGMNLGAAIKANREREEVLKGCMFTLGWTDIAASAPAATTGDGDSIALMEDIQLAESGDAEAATRVGAAYWNGQEVEKDLSKAVYWLKKASEQDNGSASFFLSYLYTGAYDPAYEDHLLAKMFLEKSWQDGYPEAGVVLGDNFRLGNPGYEHDIDIALQLYEEACGHGQDTACLRLGLLYGEGNDVPQDLRSAFKYLVEAHNLGNSDAEDYILSLGPYTLEQEKGGMTPEQVFQRTAEIWRYMSEAGYTPSDETLNDPEA